jgi:hypothetical protein
LITNNDETAYREEVGELKSVVSGKQLLTQHQQKEMIVDFRKQQREHPIHIEGTSVEKLES